MWGLQQSTLHTDKTLTSHCFLLGAVVSHRYATRTEKSLIWQWHGRVSVPQSARFWAVQARSGLQRAEGARGSHSLCRSPRFWSAPGLPAIITIGRAPNMRPLTTQKPRPKPGMHSETRLLVVHDQNEAGRELLHRGIMRTAACRVAFMHTTRSMASRARRRRAPSFWMGAARYTAPLRTAQRLVQGPRRVFMHPVVHWLLSAASWALLCTLCVVVAAKRTFRGPSRRDGNAWHDHHLPTPIHEGVATLAALGWTRAPPRTLR